MGRKSSLATCFRYFAEERLEPRVARDATSPMAGLENNRRVVALLGRREHAPFHDRARPLDEQVRIGGVVHEVDHVGPRRARGDLPNTASPLFARNHSMCVKPVVMPQRVAPSPHGHAVRDRGMLAVAERHDDGADPRVSPRIEHVGVVARAALVERHAVDADGLVRELLLLR